MMRLPYAREVFKNKEEMEKFVAGAHLYDIAVKIIDEYFTPENLLRAVKDVSHSPLGRRHELRFILILIIMATISGAVGLRAIERFIRKNKEDICEIFHPKDHHLPSRVTLGRVLRAVDFHTLKEVFRNGHAIPSHCPTEIGLPLIGRLFVARSTPVEVLSRTL